MLADETADHLVRVARHDDDLNGVAVFGWVRRDRCIGGHPAKTVERPTSHVEPHGRGAEGPPQVGGCVGGDDAASIDDGDTVGELLGLGQVMGREQDRTP